MIVRRRAIDCARAARIAYLATLNCWLEDLDNDDARAAYAAALMAFCVARDALNEIERALFDAVKDRPVLVTRPELMGAN